MSTRIVSHAITMRNPIVDRTIMAIDIITMVIDITITVTDITIMATDDRQIDLHNFREPQWYAIG
jgi:broad specificity phosphatase PhoE